MLSNLIPTMLYGVVKHILGRNLQCFLSEYSLLVFN